MTACLSPFQELKSVCRVEGKFHETNLIVRSLIKQLKSSGNGMDIATRNINHAKMEMKIIHFTS